jgi:hypothetical protein
MAKYQQTEAMTDLQEAIRIMGQAIYTMPAEDPLVFTTYINPGAMHATRFKQTAVMDDLDRGTKATDIVAETAFQPVSFELAY